MIYDQDLVGADNLDSSPPYFLFCPPGQCLGGQNFRCVDGYTGVMCNECKVGQLQFKAACDLRCDSIEPDGAHGVVTAFGIIAVMIVWVVLNKSAGGLYAHPNASTAGRWGLHSLGIIRWLLLPVSLLWLLLC